MEAAIKDLIENLRQQEKICLNMRQLARQQLEAVTDPVGCVMDGDSILKQKAKLVEDLQLVTARARLIESDLAGRCGLPEFTVKGLLGQVDHDLYQSLEQAFGEVGGLLKEIVAIDVETTELMSSRLTAFKGPRQRPTNSLRVLQAYRDASQAKKD